MSLCTILLLSVSLYNFVALSAKNDDGSSLQLCRWGCLHTSDNTRTHIEQLDLRRQADTLLQLLESEGGETLLSPSHLTCMLYTTGFHTGMCKMFGPGLKLVPLVCHDIFFQLGTMVVHCGATCHPLRQARIQKVLKGFHGFGLRCSKVFMANLRRVLINFCVCGDAVLMQLSWCMGRNFEQRTSR